MNTFIKHQTRPADAWLTASQGRFNDDLSVSGAPDVQRSTLSAGHTVRVEHTAWPEDWQPEARDALTPFLGGDVRVRIIVGPPSSIDGSVMQGFVYVEDGVPTCIFERSDRTGVFPWRLLRGPVLLIEELRPRRKPRLVYAHPEWAPR